MATKNEVVEKKSTAVAIPAMDFAADAGAGMEGAGQESFAIPFLSVLQKGYMISDRLLRPALVTVSQ